MNDIRSFSFSFQGQRHLKNHDYVLRDDALGLYVVADGVGGRPAGEVASRLAVETFQRALETLEPAAHCTTDALEEAIQRAHSAVLTAARDDSEREGMATTLSATWLDDGRAALAHVGDSRIYRYRRRELTLLSEDHGLVAEMVRQGHIDAEQARHHPLRNVLTQALGADKPLEPYLSCPDLEIDDLLLLCSDGLEKVLTNQELTGLLDGWQASGGVRALGRRMQAIIANRDLVDDVTGLLVSIGGKR